MNLKRLKDATEAATQGDWISTGVVIGVPGDGGLNYIIEATGHNPNHDNDMRYLELVQPQVVLRLIERLQEAEGKLARIRLEAQL